MHKISWRLRTAAVALAGGAAASLYLVSAASSAQAPPLRMAVEARKFEFGPKEIKVKKGQRITIVLTSPDFVHGLSMPDFKVRADGIPGKPVEVTFVADKVGKFIYLCDNFCGEGHDKMSGFLVVTES